MGAWGQLNDWRFRRGPWNSSGRDRTERTLPLLQGIEETGEEGEHSAESLAVVRVAEQAEAFFGLFKESRSPVQRSADGSLVFGDAGHHARAAVGSSSLPLGASVEIEAIFEIT